MRCATCGLANPEGVKFCIGCGVPLQHRCPSCGVENLPQARFCGECGTSLTRKPKRKREKKAGAKRKAASDSRPRTSGPRPISYTPKHLAQRILAEQAARREAVFQQSFAAEKGRDDALSRRFEEALKQAKQEPVTKPTRDFDLD